MKMSALSRATLYDVVDKLRNGERFGLYGGDKKCYFEDGISVDEPRLWEALKIVHATGTVRFKELHKLCPHNYLGRYKYSFRSCQVVRKVGQFFFGTLA